ncbi:MAG: hypothetical protein IPH45_12160 [Bacteroidales bacterium]|nr:hypothetical protein [Bacteroidales bacterium]
MTDRTDINSTDTGADSTNNGLLMHESEPLAGLILPNAGLLLLHPFLPALFRQLELISGETSVLKEEILPKAASALYFLSNANEEPMEFEIGFIKVLLGLHPMHPLPLAGGLLNDQDKEECNSLLSSVLSHWKTLGNTSVQGLQQSFLNRRGLLSEGENQWNVTIEPKAFDLLLDQLPWSISIIKLDWMKKPIFTEWRTN